MWKGSDTVCTPGKKVSQNSIHSKLKVWVGLNQACAGLKLNTLWQHFPEHSPEKLAVHGLDSPEPHWVKNCLDGEAQRVAVTESNPVAARVLPAFQHQNCPLEVPSPSLVHQGSWGELSTNISIAGKDWERWDESIAYRIWSWCNPVLLYWFGRQLKAYQNNACIVNGFFRHIRHRRSQNLS